MRPPIFLIILYRKHASEKQKDVKIVDNAVGIEIGGCERGIVKHNNRNMIGHFEGNITKLN